MSLKMLLGSMLGVAFTRVAAGIQRVEAELSDETIQVRGLAPEFDGYTIAVLSDFHHSPIDDASSVRQAVDRVRAARPDLVALLGDYGSSLKQAPALSGRWYRRGLLPLGCELRRLTAPDGIVAVLGNHDYYAGAGYVVDWLHQIGARVLVNHGVRLVRGRSTLRIAGMDDVKEGTIDPYVGCDRDECVPTIVLSHNPDAVTYLARDWRIDLVLAGHTHGGQVVIPGYGAPLTMSRLCRAHSASGWIDNPRARLYVTRGLGAQAPLPVRINCPPELVLIRLSPDPQHPA